MNAVWLLISGWLIGLVTFCLGLFIGIYIRQIEEKVADVKQKFSKWKIEKPPTNSGPVRPYTQEEKEDLDNLEHKRMKELL